MSKTSSVRDSGSCIRGLSSTCDRGSDAVLDELAVPNEVLSITRQPMRIATLSEYYTHSEPAVVIEDLSVVVTKDRD